MGCVIGQPKFNNSSYNSNQNRPPPVDPRFYKFGAKYLIRQNKKDQYEGNVPGGKMPIKLIFSLDQQCINSSYNPQLLSFEITFSDIKNPKSFGHLSLVNQYNPQNMSFSDQIITDYFFEFDQKIKIAIFYNKNYIGEEYISTAKINGSLTHTEMVPISITKNPQNPDFKLVIVSDPIDEELSRVAVSFDMRCNFNDNMSFFAVFENTYKDKRQSIYKTEESMGPRPKIMAIDIAFGDLSFDKSNDQDFDIVFYRRNRNFIEKVGKLVYSLKQLDNMAHDILNDNGMNVGSVTITPSRRTIKRFIDYIYSGMQINMIAAVDFTASNREVTQKNSLHYLGSPEPNQYQQALSSSAGIIAYYDSDQNFPCLGFGGFYNGITSHCFNLTLTDQEEVHGVEGIMNAYKHAINTVQLSGPTYFSHIIQKTIQDIRNNGTNNNYYILLIITDGQITDLKETKQAIVQASVLPLSIIIVGVGDADFSSMDLLDGDDNPLVDHTGKRIRDIVQFVPYEMKYKMNPSLFSQELLYEVPAQVEGYFRSIGQ